MKKKQRSEAKRNHDYPYLQDFLQVAHKDHVQPQLCLSAHSVEKMIPHFASHQGKYGCYCKEAEKKVSDQKQFVELGPKAIINQLLIKCHWKFREK